MTCNSVPRLLHTCVLCVPFLLFFLISAIVVWIRQEWHILGNFELTEAMQTKRQIIHFNGSNFVLSSTGSSVAGFPPHPARPRSSIVPGIVLSRIKGTIHPTAMLVDSKTVTIWSISVTPNEKKRENVDVIFHFSSILFRLPRQE